MEKSSVKIIDGDRRKLPIKILGVDIDKDCPEQLIKPAKIYFELNEFFEFKYKTSYIREKFDLNHKDLVRIRQNAKLNCEMLCEKCKLNKIKSVNSQTKFYDITRYLRKNFNEYKCDDCVAIEKKLRQEEEAKREERYRIFEEKKRKELVEKLSSAIEKKAWRNLSLFQFEVLKDCLSFDSFAELKQYYWNKNPTPYGFKKLFSALRILASENLIVIEAEFDRFRGYDIITDFKYLETLKAEFEYNYKMNDTPKVKNNPKQENQNKNSVNHIKMRLTTNDYNHHPDSPLYAGTIRFKEKIVIDPKVDYTFAQWKRSNDDLYFTLIPTAEIEKHPVQKTLSQEPKILQEHITNFLNNIEIEK